MHNEIRTARASRPGNTLADVMIQIRDVFESDQRATEQMCGSLLRIGWGDENIACVDHLRLRKGGVAVKGKHIHVSTVVHYIADEPMPAHVRDHQLHVTPSEWEACVRFTTLILISLESTTTLVPVPGARRRKLRF